MDLEKLKKEYVEQDNRMTAYPIYVQVQELVCVGAIEDGYSVACPFGDGVTKIEYSHEDFEDFDETYDNKDELIKEVKEYFGYDEERLEEEIDNITEVSLGYIWHPVEFFLTIKGAEEYIQANKHNHGKLRTYVAHFERRNFEMRGLLKEIGFKGE